MTQTKYYKMLLVVTSQTRPEQSESNNHKLTHPVTVVKFRINKMEDLELRLWSTPCVSLTTEEIAVC